MRTLRTTFASGGLIIAAALLGACSSSDESGVATDLDLSGVVVGSGGPDVERPVDDLALRTASESGGGGNGEPVGDVTARPSPPTLSPGASAGQGETSTTPAPSTTADPTTTIAPTTAVTAPTSSAEAPTESQPPAESSPGSTEATSTSLAPTTTAPLAGDLDGGEAQSHTLLNDLRVGLGLTALGRDGTMDAFARDWSRQMAESGRFEHSSGPYGENIAFTSNTSLTAAEAASLFHQLWVESPGHYANMTNDRYASTGVGLFLTERGWYGTHVFNF